MASVDNGASTISGAGTSNLPAGAKISPSSDAGIIFGNTLTSIYVPNSEASDQGISTIGSRGGKTIVAGNTISPSDALSSQQDVLFSIYTTNSEASDQGASYINTANSVVGSSVGNSLYFKMMGQDHITTTLDTWLVKNAPDYSFTQYTGGLTLPLRNVTIAGSWVV